jgi:hypothetical protein
MARRSNDVATRVADAVSMEATSALIEPAGTADPPAGDGPTSSPTITVVETPAPAAVEASPAAPEPSAPEPVEQFRVETSVYYVPTLGFGAVFVPAGTIVTRTSHDLQKLIAQGAKIRPVVD